MEDGELLKLPPYSRPILFATKRLAHRWFLAHLCGPQLPELPRRTHFQR